MCGWLPLPRPGRVPRLGIEPVTLGSATWLPVLGATPGRACLRFLKVWNKRALGEYRDPPMDIEALGREERLTFSREWETLCKFMQNATVTFCWGQLETGRLAAGRSSQACGGNTASPVSGRLRLPRAEPHRPAPAACGCPGKSVSSATAIRSDVPHVFTHTCCAPGSHSSGAQRHPNERDGACLPGTHVWLGIWIISKPIISCGEFSWREESRGSGVGGVACGMCCCT